MNILSLCDGLSCGRMALEKAGIKVDRYYASEIKDIAIKATKHNFPDTIFIGDVNKITYSDGILHTENGDFKEQFDLVIYGSPCFKAGTKVITDKGYKNIEDIQEGDMVLTHRNRFRKVTAIGHSENKQIYSLKAQGILRTYVTGNHPYLVRSMTRKYDSSIRHERRVFGEPCWKEVKDLTSSDFIGINIPFIEENPYNLDEETCWLLGRYVADGHIRHNKRLARKNSYQYGVVYSIGASKIDSFKEHLITRKASIFPHSKSVYRAVINSMDFVKFIEQHNFGLGAINKRIPQMILNLPINLCKSFLDGYISGDGFFYKQEKAYKANSISCELMIGLQRLVSKIYKTSANVRFLKTPKKYIIENREVNQHDIYLITFADYVKKQNNSFVDLENNKIWYPVREVIPTEEYTTVYNMTVDEDNSYTANNAIVHNCQSVSRAMPTATRTGLKDTVKSGLFFECNRIMKEVNPKYFLMENVVMKKEDENTITELMGVNPVRINSRIITAQMRDRLYWTNIPFNEIKPKEVKVSDILKDGYYPYDKARCLMKNDSHGYYNGCGWCPSKRFYRWYHKAFTTMIFENEKSFLDCVDRFNEIIKDKDKVSAGLFNKESGECFKKARYLWKEERARLQTIPEKYVEHLTEFEAADLIGDGWTVDIIAHIFKGLMEPEKKYDRPYQPSLFDVLKNEEYTQIYQNQETVCAN